MHAFARSETLQRELYASPSEQRDADRVARVVAEMVASGRINDAIALARAGVNLAPRSGGAWNALSYAYSFAPGFESEQTAAAREAVLHSPDDHSAWHNLSLGLMRLFEFDRALEASGRALALPSENVYYRMQAGFLASLLSDHKRALHFLDAARALVSPSLVGRRRYLAEIDIQAAMSYASLGDWENFCARLDSRHELSHSESFLFDAWAYKRLWTQTNEWKRDGEALVYLEWGIGDQIQFARLIPLALAHICNFSRVTVACSRPLMLLMREMPNVDAVIDHLDPGLAIENIRPDVAIIPVIDLMRELHRFGLFPLGTFMGPYLTVPARESGSGRPAWSNWRPRRKPGKIAIAFCWQGDPKQPQDFNRRIPFPAWGEFARRYSDRYTFHSVQAKFAGYIDPWEGWPAGVEIEDCSLMIHDMRDVAEIISRCDVFVGQCGANLHLAGALGVPAVAMLGASHDYRWDFEPLYDVRLVKQDRPGDWSSAFAQLDAAISEVTRRTAAIQEER
jgi:tetratricopeptide (TPR) repeat protein